MDWVRYSPLLMRAAIGIIFVAHGFPKLFVRTAEIAGFFAKAGIPFPLLTVMLVGVIEFCGGLALLAGLWTRAAASLLALVMAGAILFVKGSTGLVGGYELDLLLLAGTVSLALTGPGAYALNEDA